MSKVPESAKRLVRAVLFSEWGVPLDEFAKDFKELEGKAFPYEEYGFSSVRECLETIPDVVRFEFSQEASRWILYAVADETSFMSSFTKKKQLSNNMAGLSKKKRRRRNKSQTNSNNQSGNEFICNQKGLFSVIIKSRDVDLGLEDITALIQSTAPIAESNCFKRLLFFRYKKRAEAEAVIKKFNKYNFKGNKLVVQRAAEKLGPAGNNRNQTNGTDQRSHPETNTQPSLPSSPPTTHKRPDDLLPETSLSALPKQLPLTRNGFNQVSKVQDPMSDPNSTAPVTSDLNIHMTSHVHAPLAPRDVVSSPSKAETLPPPLLDDDQYEDSESEDWSSSSEEGPPPLVDSSDSEGWSDSDNDVSQPFRSPEKPTENGFSMQSMELQIEQLKLKQISPGRGRGLLSFQHR